MKQSVIWWLAVGVAASVIVTADVNGGDIMAPNVKREDGKVWIESVKGFSPADYRSSVHGSQARILQTVGESMTYDDLVCYGGFAFRVDIDDRLCPSAGHPCCGYMCVENSNKAILWRTKMYESFPWGTKRDEEELKAFRAEVCDAIKASIDRGIPVNYVAEEYGKIGDILMEGVACPWSLLPQPKESDEANSERRQKQIARLESARQHDLLAIQAISRALDTLDQETAEHTPAGDGLKAVPEQ